MVKRLDGGRTSRSVRVWAQTEPWRPDSGTGKIYNNRPFPPIPTPFCKISFPCKLALQKSRTPLKRCAAICYIETFESWLGLYFLKFSFFSFRLNTCSWSAVSWCHIPPITTPFRKIDFPFKMALQNSLTPLERCAAICYIESLESWLGLCFWQNKLIYFPFEYLVLERCFLMSHSPVLRCAAASGVFFPPKNSTFWVRKQLLWRKALFFGARRPPAFFFHPKRTLFK